MELYKDYPRLCTIWCFIEILFYAGQLFGWSSILYVLKQEGFYNELCVPIDKAINSLALNQTEIDIPNANETLIKYTALKELAHIFAGSNVSTEIGDQIAHANYNKNSLEYGTPDTQTNEYSYTGCDEQDARLNLWFSVAICVSYVMCSIMGPILQKVGMRCFRLILMCTYVTGALCLGFATPEVPWLICPGLCCIGVAGMALYSTNIHVSFLFPAVQSTITSVFVGLYDASTVVTFLMKVAFDGGVARRYFYTGLALFHLVLIGTSTFLFLPCVRIKPRLTNKRTEQSGKILTNTKDEREKFIKKNDEGKPSSYRTLFSCEYLLHVYWMCVQSLRFVTFLGFFNTWLTDKFHGNIIKESYYLAVFSYVTMATIITAVTAGMLHDCQRRKYMMSVDFKRRRLPIILPLTVTSLMSVVFTSLIYIELEIFLNIVFVLFTIYRSYLFSFEITFLNDIYPLTSFSVLFGVLHSSAGLSGMLQYPMFEWYQTTTSAPDHVNIFMICLAVSSLAHPLYLWYKCRTHQDNDGSKFLGTEIHI